MAAIFNGEHLNRPVNRRLFAITADEAASTVDQWQREYDHESKFNLFRKIKEWGFDFTNDRPLDDAKDSRVTKWVKANDPPLPYREKHQM